MTKIELNTDTYEFLKTVKASLQTMGKYDTWDDVIKEMCMVYYWRYEE